MRTIILCLITCLIGILPANASFLRNIPRSFIQPNGDTLNCFVSGDEFYNYLHDENGYTIILNTNTGYYVYAQKIQNRLVPSEFIAGSIDPRTIGIQPFLNISAQQWQDLRNAQIAQTPQLPNTRSRENTGTFNNLVVFIRFSDDNNFSTSFATINNMFNDTVTNNNSLYNYFKSASYNQLFVRSSFYPTPNGDVVLSYQDSHVRDYFMPYSATNSIGYDGETQRREREHTLLANAIAFVENAIPISLNIDYNDDDYVDNVCFIIKGGVSDWSTLLWPHRWTLYSQSVFIHGKRVYDYNFQLEGNSIYFSNGVLCHEMFHSLGAPDLYHYTDEDFTPVGDWDLMESTNNPPQHMGAYMKYEYGQWINSIPTLTQYGTYALYPLSSPSSFKTCYKIPSGNPSEFYVVEYRKTSTPFESDLPGSGLLIYRINTNFHGNADYDGISIFDEVYVFRPNGTTTNDGNTNNAYFSANVSRTSFTSTTNPSPFLTNGTPGTFEIHSITTADDSIQFYYGPLNGCNAPSNLTSNTLNDSIIQLSWDTVQEAIYYNLYRNNTLIATHLTGSLYIDTVPQNGLYYYKLSATCILGNSDYSNSTYSYAGPLEGRCYIHVHLNDSYGDGWNNAHLVFSYNDGTPNDTINFSDGFQSDFERFITRGTTVSVSWIAGIYDSECSFTIEYADGTQIYQSNGSPSSGFVISFMVLCTPLPCTTPSNLEITPIIRNNIPSMLLEWNSTSDAISYDIFYNGNSIFTTEDTTVYVNNVTEGVEYCFTIAANCSSNVSPHSIEQCDYPGSTSNCPPPVNLSAVDNNGSVSLSWEIQNVDNDSVIFVEDFEGTLNWLVSDADGDSYNWGISSGNVTVHSGTHCATSASYNNVAGVLHPDNWLISPMITLAPNSQLSYWTCAQDANYPAEHYGVYISTTGNSVSDFTTLLFEETHTTSGRIQTPWVNRTIDLSYYSGPVYIAFRHFNCYDQFYLNIDDIQITCPRPQNSNLFNVYKDSILIAQNVNDTVYTDYTPSNGNHCYTVTSICSNSESSHSYHACLNLQMETVTLTAEYQNNRAILQWQASGNPIAFNLLKNNVPIVTNTTNFSFVDSVFDCSTEYCYRIQALYNNIGIFSSNNACFTTINHTTYGDTLTISECDSFTFAGETYTQSGFYSITLPNSHNCDSITPLHLTIYESPNITIDGDMEIMQGESTTLTATGADSYLWSNGTLNNAITVSPNMTTTYSVTGTNTHNCTHTNSATVVVSNGINYNIYPTVNIFPNPAYKSVTIQGVEIEKITFFSSLGQRLQQYNLIDSESTEIDLSNYKSGVYNIIISTKNQEIIVKKLIIR